MAAKCVTRFRSTAPYPAASDRVARIDRKPSQHDRGLAFGLTLKSMSEIQQADPKARQRAVCIFGCCAVVGVVVILAFLSGRPSLEAWVIQDPAQMGFRLRLVIGTLGFLIAVPLAGLAVYIWRFGSLVRRAKRFPPPGVAVIRDTPILWDRAAQKRGLLLQLLAAFLTVAIGVVLVLLWMLAGQLEAKA